MSWKRGLVVAGVVLTACTTNPPPIVIPPPIPIPLSVKFTVLVRDEAGAPVTEAAGRLDLDVDAPAGEAPIRLVGSGWSQEFIIATPPGHVGWSGDFTATSPNYITASARIPPLMDGTSFTVTMKSWSHVGDERGWLRRSGKQIVKEDGSTWRYRGYSAFPYLKMHCEGRDINPLLDDAIDAGARVFRTLGMFEGSLGSFRLAVDDPARFDECLDSYQDLLKARLVRSEFVTFADAQHVMPETSRQKAWQAHVEQRLDAHWNALGELCNECAQNGVDPDEFTKPQTRTLWARGSGLGNQEPPGPGWDYSTYHEARDDENVRKNECRVIMDDPTSPSHGMACIQDEPIGASETNQPGRRVGAINGDPTRAITHFTLIGANYGLQNAGGTCHTDAGLVGGLMGPVQRAMCQAFFRGLDWAPLDAHRQVYQRGDNCGDCNGIGGMPLQQLDDFEIRIFCRQQESEWCLVVTADLDNLRYIRRPIPRDGFRIVDEPFPGLLRLLR